MFLQWIKIILLNRSGLLAGFFKLELESGELGFGCLSGLVKKNWFQVIIHETFLSLWCLVVIIVIPC